MGAPEPRRIEPEGWSRREAYELFRGFGLPFFSLTADVDVTALRGAAHTYGVSFTVGLVYLLSRAANEIPAFRQRIRGDAVVEHDVVHPSITVLAHDDSFRFVTLRFESAFSRFAPDAAKRIDAGRRADSLWMEPDRDDFLFMTALPWITFSAMVHPASLEPGDSVPLLAWGKYVAIDGKTRMPLNVQANHALVDGIHVGRYFERVQALLDQAGSLLALDPRTGTAERS
jgi:chloramphenicol O-acetyltransferase type A